MWAIPWGPCIHEFLAIVTHPRIFAPPPTIEQAINQVDAWRESPTLVMIGESNDHWAILCGQLTDGHVRGSIAHDARVATLCVGNRVREILTADRDFDRFHKLSTRNPLIAAL